jgi:hypothetical protein
MSPLARTALVALIAAASLFSVATSNAATLRAPHFRARLLADLASRGVEFGRDGTPDPAGGLTPDGSIDGRRAQVVRLVVPPRDSADMFEETGYVDRRGRQYWAVRTGGFFASVRWVGPFGLPRPRRASR